MPTGYVVPFGIWLLVVGWVVLFVAWLAIELTNPYP